MANSPLIEDLLTLDTSNRLERLRELDEIQLRELQWHWRLWARPEQLAPDSDWRIWLVMAGRGFGKTRAGSEWVREIAEHNPDARIALVGSTLAEARSVMVEGESGVLSICPPAKTPLFEPSLRRLTWPNGAQATLYSAQEPESLRGSQNRYICGPSAKGVPRERRLRLSRSGNALRHQGRCEQHARKPD